MLDGNSIGRKGGIQVAAMLQVNRTLTTLQLARTDLETDCIIAMATVLHGNSTLECVDLTRPLLHSKLEEPTIHISKMLQVGVSLCLSMGRRYLCGCFVTNILYIHVTMPF